MANTVNILGDTAKQQWLSAINIYHLAIQSNIEFAINAAENERDDGELRALDKAHELVGDFTDEMRRLVEGVFDED